MLKILHVYRTYFPDTQGGLEEVIRQICFASKKNGATNRVFSLSRNPSPSVLDRAEAQVVRGKLHLEVASCGVSFSSLATYKKLIFWADVVHYHFPWPFADFLHFIANVKKPIVITYHSDIVRQKGLLKLYAPLMHHFLKSADVIVPTSANYASSSQILTKYSHKLEVIPIGVDSNTYPCCNQIKAGAWHEKVGDGFFFFVGVLRYYKGLHVLLEAIRNTNIRIVIAGQGSEDKHLKDLVIKFDLKNVRFLGFVSNEDKVALMSLAKAVVFPSHLRSEAFGVTLVEGLMFGKPLISCDIGTGTSYVNEDGITGLVVPPSDSEALKRAMLEMENNPELVQKMGLAARERYESFFTGKLMGEAYIDLYSRLFNR